MAGTELGQISSADLGSTGAEATFVEVLRARAERDLEGEAFAFLDWSGEAVAALSFGELDRRARELAGALQALAEPGDRALLAYTPGIECVVAIYACVYAGLIVVPAPPPDPAREHAGPRIRLVAEDCEARLALTATDMGPGLEEVLAEAGSPRPRVVVTDAPDLDRSAEWADPGTVANDIALLQYTSGSTGSPRGVMVSHENLIHNCELVASTFGGLEAKRAVMWLPPYHDMGVIGGILAPVHGGFPVALMSPISFMLSPISWLRAVSRFRATLSAGPDFAYDMCVRRTEPGDRQGLDLSSWQVAFNGAEVVRRETIDAFSDAFAVHGFRREAFYPCFGLAEATLMVTGGDPRSAPTVRVADRAALEAGSLEPADPGGDAVAMVGCGAPGPDTEVVVVDPETIEALPDGSVGEIWVRGGGVAGGYWGREEETRLTFEARLPGRGEQHFLRTGDLGLVADGELYVNGRIKDVLVIDGRVHYPTDVERIAEGAAPALRHNSGVAFTYEHEGENRLGLVYEANETDDDQAVLSAVREHVASELGLELGAIALLAPRTIPRTTSGKLKRIPCRAQYLNGQLEPRAEWRR